MVAVRALHETMQLHQATADMVHSQPLQAFLSLADAAALSADTAASAASAASNVLSGATADGTVDAGAQTAQRAGGWFGFISDGLETVLAYIQSGLQQLHVPYTYGWSIILLTCIVKLALLPVTKIQVGASREASTSMLIKMPSCAASTSASKPFRWTAASPCRT